VYRDADILCEMLRN